MAPRLTVILAFALAITGLAAGNELTDGATEGEAWIPFPGRPKAHPPTRARSESFWPFDPPLSPGPPKRPPTAARDAEAFEPFPPPFSPGPPKRPPTVARDAEAFEPFPSPLNPGRPPTKVARQVPTVPPTWGDPRHPPPRPPFQPAQARRSDSDSEELEAELDDSLSKRQHPITEPDEADVSLLRPAMASSPEKRSESESQPESELESESESEVTVIAEIESELQRRQRCHLSSAQVPPDCGLLPPEHDTGRHTDTLNKEKRNANSRGISEEMRKIMGPRRPSARN